MPNVTLFYDPTRKYGIAGGGFALNFDLLLSESHSFSNTITGHTVENGSPVDDHIQNDLMTIGITGLVSNFSVFAGELTTNRALDAFNLLEQLWRKKALVTVVTGLKVYEGVAITSIATDRGSDSGEMQVFSIGLREFRRVVLKSVVIETAINITDLTEPIQQQASPPVDVGRTTAKTSADLGTLQFRNGSIAISR